jgi:tetratricopeptide (TPR) repeat protein/predicted Ser/Thr protein kinase
VGCLDENTVAELVARRLPAAEAATAEEHLDSCEDCSALVAALAKGLPTTADVIGRYRIVKELGAGAMGIVYEAHDPQLDRRVAIKVLRRGAGRGLQREAQVLARLDHPNVVAVYDVGTEGDDVFVAMALVEGRTLGAWLAEQRRGTAEIVATFVSAGRGLLAAHQQGIVHRDFKPANVLVGSDGTVRVADFGVARIASENGGAASGPGTGGALVASAFAGTPAYMSPEQLACGVIDARSDQFSFCVALHEAVYGERPFRGRDVDELKRSVDAGLGELARTAPAWVRRVLERGLATDPERRYPTMRELVADLTREPARPGRRVGLIVGAVGLVAIAGGIALATRRGGDAAPKPCTGAERELAGIWGVPERIQVVAAVRATALPYAADVASSIEHRLDAYADAWVAAHTNACEATIVRRERTDEQLSQQMLCLDDRKRSFAAVSTLFVHANRDIVPRAVDVVSSLPPIADCNDLRLLAMRLKPPADPAVRARLQAVATEVANVRALRAAGQYQQALPRAQQLVEDTRKVAYRPAQATALHDLGNLQADLSDANAQRTLREAALAAEAAGDDTDAVQAWIDLANTTGFEEGKISEAEDWLGHAEAMLERVGGDAKLEAELFNSRAAIALARGKFDEARTLFEKAIERGTGHSSELRVQNFRSNVAVTLMRMNRHADAIPYLREALAADERIYGPRHPKVAESLENLGAAASLIDHDEGEKLLTRARTIYADAYGRDSLKVGGVLVNLGFLAFERRQHQQAYDLLSRALAIQEHALPPDHFDVGITAGNVCHALLPLARYKEAVPLCQRSHDILAKAFGADSPDLAESLAHLAAAKLGLGDARGAREPAERAVSLLAGPDADPTERAEYQFILARVLGALGADKARGRSLATGARAAYAATGDNDREIADIDAWLAGKR